MNELPLLGSGGAGLDDHMWVESARSDFGSFGQLEGIFDVNAEIADGAFNLGMPQKDLNGAQVAGRLLDDRRLGAPKRVRVVILGLEADPGYPLPYQPGVLPRVHVAHVIVAAREYVIVDRAATTLKPGEQGLSSRFYQLELDWPFRFLLHDESAIPDATTGDDVTDAHLDHVAAAKLAVDGEVEERPI